MNTFPEVGGVQRTDHIQQSTLAGTRLPDNRNKLTFGDGECRLFQSADRSLASPVCFGDILTSNKSISCNTSFCFDTERIARKPYCIMTSALHFVGIAVKATPQNTQKERPCGKIPPGRAYIRHSISACSRTDLSRQAGSPVSQNQIRQREQDIQFGNLFSQTSVPGFPVSKLALYYPKDMLYLGPYGRFLLFAAFDLPAGTIVCVFTLRGPPVDL